ncbi:hypothetical protein [uncultured Oxalicibacterium sp.]|uniref:hypothetical protein n=1 Tax=uncultured Oxalicibacterium sp. TaxID=1168540 RepID=UPI0025F8677E|nr:hypothetical protein [uncultured Oxalicibacterium sp.]
MKSLFTTTLVAGCVFSASLALAQKPPVDASVLDYSVADVVQRYPAGSIQSGDRANQAIKDVEQSRLRVEARFEAQQQACYPKFFTTSCLNKVTEQRRVDLMAIRPIELEANSYIRHARVAERDRRLEESAKAREARNAERSSVPVPEINDMPRQQQGLSDAQRAARAQEHAEKNAERAERERQRKASEESDARQRARNVERYEEKVRESEERQREVAKRKAENEAGQTDK